MDHTAYYPNAGWGPSPPKQARTTSSTLTPQQPPPSENWYWQDSNNFDLTYDVMGVDGIFLRDVIAEFMTCLVRQGWFCAFCVGHNRLSDYGSLATAVVRFLEWKWTSGLLPLGRCVSGSRPPDPLYLSSSSHPWNPSGYPAVGVHLSVTSTNRPGPGSSGSGTQHNLPPSSSSNASAESSTYPTVKAEPGETLIPGRPGATGSEPLGQHQPSSSSQASHLSGHENETEMEKENGNETLLDASQQTMKHAQTMRNSQTMGESVVMKDAQTMTDVSFSPREPLRKDAEVSANPQAYRTTPYTRTETDCLAECALQKTSGLSTGKDDSSSEVVSPSEGHSAAKQSIQGWKSVVLGSLSGMNANDRSQIRQTSPSKKRELSPDQSLVKKACLDWAEKLREISSSINRKTQSRTPQISTPRCQQTAEKDTEAESSVSKGISREQQVAHAPSAPKVSKIFEGVSKVYTGESPVSKRVSKVSSESPVPKAVSKVTAAESPSSKGLSKISTVESLGSKRVSKNQATSHAPSAYSKLSEPLAISTESTTAQQPTFKPSVSDRRPAAVSPQKLRPRSGQRPPGLLDTAAKSDLRITLDSRRAGKPTTETVKAMTRPLSKRDAAVQTAIRFVCPGPAGGRTSHVAGYVPVALKPGVDASTETKRPRTRTVKTMTLSAFRKIGVTQTWLPNVRHCETMTAARSTTDSAVATEEADVTEMGIMTEPAIERESMTEFAETSDAVIMTESSETTDAFVMTDVSQTTDRAVMTELTDTTDIGAMTDPPNTTDAVVMTMVAETRDSLVMTDLTETFDTAVMTPLTETTSTMTETTATADAAAMTNVIKTEAETMTESPETVQVSTLTETTSKAENPQQTDSEKTTDGIIPVQHRGADHDATRPSHFASEAMTSVPEESDQTTQSVKIMVKIKIGKGLQPSFVLE